MILSVLALFELEGLLLLYGGSSCISKGYSSGISVHRTLRRYACRIKLYGSRHLIHQSYGFLIGGDDGKHHDCRHGYIHYQQRHDYDAHHIFLHYRLLIT